MGPDDFDPRFRKLLGDEAARTLEQWSARLGLSLRWSRTFVNGRSTAFVAAVYERVPGVAARKLILKHDKAVGDRGEFGRQHDALKSAGGFRPHLTELAHEPIVVPDGSCITFQNVAGGSLDETHVLTSLLAAVPGMSLTGIETEDIVSDSDTLVRVCSTVVGDELTSWAIAPDIRHEPVSRFLRRHLADRMATGKSMAELARLWPGPAIILDGERTALPNPFAFVTNPSPRLDVELAGIVGNGHGDLHTENVLVKPDGTDFWLIDLSRFEPDAPLTQDPVQLVLSIVNHTLDRLTEPQREVLLRVLATPAQDQWTGLPLWLGALVRGVRDAGQAWIAPYGLADEWRRATTLSTLACSLIYAARPTTSVHSRAWFLRLAARSAAAFMDGDAADGDDGSDEIPGPRPPLDTGLGALCSILFDLRTNAAARGRMAEVESIVAHARHGYDIRTELERLAAQLDIELTRTAVSDLAGRPATVAPYRCPNARSCGRVDQRTPGGGEPFCHVDLEPMSMVGRAG